MSIDRVHNLQTPTVQEISPYDASYPMELLSSGIKKELDKAQQAAQNIYRATVRNMPVATQIQEATNKGCRYVVDTSENTLRAIESGALKLTRKRQNLCAASCQRKI